jgi:cytochrome b561
LIKLPDSIRLFPFHHPLQPTMTTSNTPTSSVSRYHPALVALHWLMALMIMALLLGGSLVTAPTPNTDPEKIGHLKGHMIVALSVGVLMVPRLLVRLRTRHPAPAKSGMAWADRVAPWTHWVFYLLVFTMLASGMTMAAMTGLPDIVFNGKGSLPPDFWHLPARAVHGIVAKALLALIALHIGAALYHQVIRKDGLLSRMWFGQR